MEHFAAQESLDRLLASIEACRQYVCRNVDELVIHMAEWPQFTKARTRTENDRFLEAITDIHMRDGDDGRATRNYPGVIEADAPTLDLFCELNASKANFKDQMQLFRERNPQAHNRYTKFLRTGQVETRGERYAARLGRLSVNHLYRQFLVLRERPESISYSWSSRSASIIRLSRTDAIAALEKLSPDHPDHLRIQIDRLARLPSNEPLAKVIPNSAAIKVNMVFEDKKRRTAKPGLPILVPAGSKGIRIKFIHQGDISRKSARLERSDRRIEEAPIAPSIHVFRYIEGYRQ